MARPLLVDLYCGAGGASVGYHRAGFDVVGVDNARQPRYPFDLVEADALDFLSTADLSQFDAIHASPPCQAHSTMRHLWNSREHLDLVGPTREALRQAGLPWVIENVPGAPIRPDLVLCGEMFGLRVRRHRWFETSPRLYQLMPPCRHDTTPVGVYGHPGGTSSRDYRRVQPGRRSELSARRQGAVEWRQAMGVDWMTSRELSQAIPPAYTEYVGSLLLAGLKAVA